MHRVGRLLGGEEAREIMPFNSIQSEEGPRRPPSSSKNHSCSLNDDTTALRLREFYYFITIRVLSATFLFRSIIVFSKKNSWGARRPPG